MAFPIIPVAVVSILALLGIATGAYQDSKNEAIKTTKRTQKELQKYSGSETTKELENYLHDQMMVGNIDGETYKNTLQVYERLRNNNYDFKKAKITKEEAKQLTKMYNQVYEGDVQFKSLWDQKWGTLTDEEKLEWLRGGTSLNATIPAPAYLDASFDNYLREEKPLKLYTNKELADIYNIDFDMDNILKDYNDAAQAAVTYNDWLSNQIANTEERDNAYNQTSYLDAIRNVKSEAVIKGMADGAKAAAEVLANNKAVQDKANSEAQTAMSRFQQMDDALLNRAETALNARNMYTGLAKTLSSGVTGFYANDVTRLGGDIEANANFFSSDEQLRANRMAANAVMNAAHRSALAQNAVYQGQADEAYNYFKDITLPAYNGDFHRAVADFINLGYNQKTGFKDAMSKWAYFSDKK